MILIDKLSFSYGRKKLFWDMDLSLKQGGICGLLGKNGAGKTTLLKLMAGLRFPEEGRVRVNDVPPGARSTSFLQELFFLPETFDLPPATPLRYEQLFSCFYPGFQKERYLRYLHDFEIPVNKKMNFMSYGQKKKIMIAFGLATGCRLMLMDEPTNGLDIPSKSKFRKAVASSLTDEQLFVIATHQVRDLDSLLDSVVIMDAGRVVFSQSIEAVSNHLKIGFQMEPPDASTLLYSEKRLGGYGVVMENREGELSNIDLEMLFACVLENRERVSDLFRKEKNDDL